jgi:hypothetical protein
LKPKFEWDAIEFRSTSWKVKALLVGYEDGCEEGSPEGCPLGWEVGAGVVPYMTKLMPTPALPNAEADGALRIISSAPSPLKSDPPHIKFPRLSAATAPNILNPVAGPDTIVARLISGNGSALL